MRNETITLLHSRRVVLMDSISLIGPEDAGSIIVCGSHGGLISGAFASLYPPRLVVFNDAGGGKLDAGRASLAMLDRKGIASATVSHDSARISDAQDSWLYGVLSAVGEAARGLGLRLGQSVKDAAEVAART
jgi:hypothetical protein